MFWRAVRRGSRPPDVSLSVVLVPRPRGLSSVLKYPVSFLDLKALKLRNEFTFLCYPLRLMSFQSFIAIFSFHRRVGACFGELETHLLAKDFEGVDFVNGFLCAIDGVINDESLSFGFQVLFRDDVDDGAIFGEDAAQGLYELGDLDGVIEIADLWIRSVRKESLSCRRESSHVDSRRIVSFLSFSKRVFVRSAMYERCAGRDLVVLVHDGM